MEFRFKQFAIRQDRCAMKVGTDGVLLGSCVSITGQEKHILDIGTGTGLIALMAAQRMSAQGNSSFHIDAVEIDPEAAQQAAQNCEQSPWGKQMTVHPMPLAQFSSEAGYDLILSNPPFYNATLKPDDEARALARHKDALPLVQIMSCADSLLSADGRLALIYPTAYDTEVMTEALLAHLRPQRIIRIYTKVGKPCKRIICEFVRQSNTTLSLSSEELYLRNADSEYSAEYRAITAPFYLSLK